MKIESLRLHNFRSLRRQTFDFKGPRTIIIGPNASGKSNLLEAVYLLSTGRSLRASRDTDLIYYEAGEAVVEGQVTDVTDVSKNLLLQILRSGEERSAKKFKVNGVGRSLANFAGDFAAVLFEPEDIQLVLGSPDLRRNYLNIVLSVTSRIYRRTLPAFDAVRRNRNRVLEAIREGSGEVSDLEFWDGKMIELAPIVTESRSAFLDFLSRKSRGVTFSYHPSLLTAERLFENREREVAAGATLYGPHRDDFAFESAGESGTSRNLAVFGSRGEQRMAVFDLKMLEISFLEESLGAKPVLLLDDIFSELDNHHRQRITKALSGSQVILTTAEADLLKSPLIGDFEVLSLSSAEAGG